MCGLPGSGKSYNTVLHQILPALRSGRRVATNIPLNLEAVQAELAKLPEEKRGFLVEFDVQELEQEPARIFDCCTPGTVFVIDEVWRLFPAGKRADKVPEPFRKLLAEHRHMKDAKGDTCQIVLVTQDLAQISAFARQLVEQTFIHTKLSSVGLSKSFRVDIYNGSHTGQRPPDNQRLNQVFGTYKADVYKFYKSHTLSEGDGGATNERKIDGRGNIFRRPIWWIGGAFVLVGGWWGISAASSGLDKDESKLFGDRKGQPTEIQPSGTVSGGVAGIVGGMKSAAPVAPVTAWRVLGWVVMESGTGSALLLAQDGRQAQVPISQCADISTAGPAEYVCGVEGIYWDRNGIRHDRVIARR